MSGGCHFEFLVLCQMTKLLARRYMVSPHTATPSGALRYTHTHAQSVLSNVASFWKTEFPLQSVCSNCMLTCRQLFDLPVHLN